MGDVLETVFVKGEVDFGMLPDVADGHFLQVPGAEAFFGCSNVHGAGGGGWGDGVGVEVVGDFGEDGWWGTGEVEGLFVFILRGLVFGDRGDGGGRGCSGCRHVDMQSSFGFGLEALSVLWVSAWYID